MRSITRCSSVSTFLAVLIFGGLLGSPTSAQQTTVVPPVVRQSVEQAMATIQAAGLTVGGVVEDPRYVLGGIYAVGTTPPAGTVLAVGSSVTIRVSVAYRR